MRELAVQAASDNLNADDRDYIDLEYQQNKRSIGLLIPPARSYRTYAVERKMHV